MAGPSRVSWTLVALGAALLAVGIGGWLHFRPAAPLPVATPVAVAPAPPTVPVPPDPPLPPPADTDARLRGLFAALSPLGAWRAWLTKDDLLTRLVATADVLSQGETPRTQLDFLAPRKVFAAEHRHGRLVIDPRSYRRYDAVADVIGSLDARACAKTYGALLPLLRVAYHVFGYPQRDFDQTVHRALARLEAAPLPRDEPQLLSVKGALYRFADPRLEALDGVQKQLLRMGPRNMVRIQTKAREFDALIKAGPD